LINKTLITMKFNQNLALFSVIAVLFVVFFALFSQLPKKVHVSEELFCGGFAGKQCPSGYECDIEGNYPDAGGTCIKK